MGTRSRIVVVKWMYVYRGKSYLWIVDWKDSMRFCTASDDWRSFLWSGDTLENAFEEEWCLANIRNTIDLLKIFHSGICVKK